MMTIQIKCPRCGTATTWQGNKSKPFCSEKCRLVDLGRWANQEYTLDGGKAPQHDRDNDLEY